MRAWAGALAVLMTIAAGCGGGGGGEDASKPDRSTTTTSELMAVTDYVAIIDEEHAAFRRLAIDTAVDPANVNVPDLNAHGVIVADAIGQLVTAIEEAGPAPSSIAAQVRNLQDAAVDLQGSYQQLSTCAELTVCTGVLSDLNVAVPAYSTAYSALLAAVS